MRRLAVSVLLLLAACSSQAGDSPELTFADFTDPTTTPTVLDGTQPSTTAVPTTTTLPEPATTTTTATTLATEAPSAALIMLEAASASLWQPGEQAPSLLVDEALETIHGDGQGGFVLQLRGAGSDSSADQRIYWSRAANPDAQPFLAVAEGALLRLWGVPTIDGRPQMLITTTDAPTSPTPGVVKLIAYDFQTGPQELGVVGDGTGGPQAISVGGGQILLEQRRGANSYFEFRNYTGDVLGLEYNPLTECVDDSTCPRMPALAPAGGLIAYLQSSFAEAGTAATSLVLYDVDLGVEADRFLLPEGDVAGLAFDGSTVIVNRNRDESPLLVDLGTYMISQSPHTGSAVFLAVAPGFTGSFELVGK